MGNPKPPDPFQVQFFAPGSAGAAGAMQAGPLGLGFRPLVFCCGGLGLGFRGPSLVNVATVIGVEGLGI